MSRRGAGVMFCLIAALLFLGRYLAAAIFGSGLSSWNEALFSAMLQYVGTPLLTVSVLSLFVGIGYLVWAERSNGK